MKRWLVGAVLVVAGCKPAYGGVRFFVENELGEETSEVSEAEIRVLAGVPVLVKATLESSKRKDYESGKHSLRLESEDDDILLVERTDVAWEFVFVGGVAGETCVRVIVEDEDEGCIPAVVLAQQRREDP